MGAWIPYRVTVKGSDQPIGLYTYDVDTDLLEIDRFSRRSNRYSMAPPSFSHSKKAYSGGGGEFEEVRGHKPAQAPSKTQTCASMCLPQVINIINMLMPVQQMVLHI
jgi:hypothetical protein